MTKILIRRMKEEQDSAPINIPHNFSFSKPVLRNFLEVKNSVLDKGTSAVVIIDGRSNAGKSSLASQVGLLWDPKMTMEKNYCWNMDRFLELMEHPYKGMVILFDESMVLNSRSANSSENIKTIIALSQIRSKQVFIIFCINSIYNLEKSIPLSRANFLLHVKRIGGINGRPKFCCYDQDKMRQLIVRNGSTYSYAGVYPNISWQTFSKYFPFDNDRYDTMKHKESVKNLQEKTKTDGKSKYQMALYNLIKGYEKERGKKISQREIATITGVVPSTISEWVRKAKEIEEKK